MRASDAEGAVADLAAYQHGVISRSQAASLGMSREVLRHRIDAGLWVPATPRVLVAASAPASWEQSAMVATLAGGVLSHRAAARLHGLDGFRDAVLELSVRRGGARPTVDALLHTVTPLHRNDLTEVRFIAVTTIERTLCDLGSVAAPDRVEQALDAAMRRGMTTARLRRVARRLHRPGQRGTGVLLGLLDDPRRKGRVADSWFERLVERIVRQPGMPPLVRQHEVFDRYGDLVARVDVAIPSVKVAIECHSRQFHFGPRQERLDQLREHQLLREGWVTLYVGYTDTRHPDQVLQVVCDTVRARSVEKSRA